MKMISLREFQSATGLSNDALVWLIKNNKLTFEYNKTKGLLVDIDGVNKNQLIQSMLEKEVSDLESNKDIIKERLSIVVASKVEELFEEALSRLLK
jgi:hypothetical protein